MKRPFGRPVALATMLLATGLLVCPSPGAQAQAAASTSPGNQPPVVADDSVTMTPFTPETHVHVLSNDADPEHGNLQICRLEGPDDAGLSVHIWSDQGGFADSPAPSGSTYLTLEPTAKLRTGTLSVTYYACDRELLTPGTLTVNVVRITAQTVAGHPGVVRFSNPLDYAVDVIYAAPRAQDADGAVRIKPHGTKDRKVRHSTIRWFAIPHAAEGDGDPLPIDYGTLRHTGARGGDGPRASLTTRQERAWQARLTPSARHSPVGASTVRRDDPPADPSGDAAPTTAPDQVTLDYYDGAAVRVLANDSDDTPADLAVCWVDVPPGVGLYALIEPWWADSDRARSDSPDRYIDLGAEAATPGTYALTYYACDKQRMTPGILTVTVRTFPPVEVRRVAGRPGTLEFINRGYRSVAIHYFPSNHYSEKFHFRIKPNAHHRLHVSYDDLSFFADTKIGPLNSGRIKHLYPSHRRAEGAGGRVG